MKIGSIIGARATTTWFDVREQAQQFHDDERGGLGGQQAIISGGLLAIAIAVTAVLWIKASGGATAIPDAPTPSTSFP